MKSQTVIESFLGGTTHSRSCIPKQEYDAYHVYKLRERNIFTRMWSCTPKQEYDAYHVYKLRERNIFTRMSLRFF